MQSVRKAQNRQRRELYRVCLRVCPPVQVIYIAGSLGGTKYSFVVLFQAGGAI